MTAAHSPESRRTVKSTSSTKWCGDSELGETSRFVQLPWFGGSQGHPSLKVERLATWVTAPDCTVVLQLVWGAKTDDEVGMPAEKKGAGIDFGAIKTNTLHERYDRRRNWLPLSSLPITFPPSTGPIRAKYSWYAQDY
jgi:hypothetical protein